jgi:hypothetical protein
MNKNDDVKILIVDDEEIGSSKMDIRLTLRGMQWKHSIN